MDGRRGIGRTSERSIVVDPKPKSVSEQLSTTLDLISSGTLSILKENIHLIKIKTKTCSQDEIHSDWDSLR